MFLHKKRRKINALARSQVRIGSGNSWLPKILGKKRKKSIAFFEKSLSKDAEHWRLMFGQTTPRMIWNISQTLPFFDKRAHTLSPLNRVTLLVNRMHTGDNFGKVGARFGIPKSIACNYFHDGMRKFNMVHRKVVKLPTAEERVRMEQTLRRRGDDIPSIHFIMDATHIYCPINDGWESTK
ncbi:MAG: hypothetical protein GY928_21735 [Colwellia sp.]|nr:hypothetical protein [Colwellia sp.]